MAEERPPAVAMRGSGRQKKVFSDESDFYILGADGLRARLKTFNEYSGEGNILNLARAGFSATIFPGVVQCKLCNTYLHDIMDSDDPFTLHILICPDCLHNYGRPIQEINLNLRNALKRTKGCGFCPECIVNNFKL